MPLVRASFAWAAESVSDGYQIFHESTQIADVTGISHEMELDIPYGAHNFSIRGYNTGGNGPLTSVAVELVETVPVVPPGPVAGFNVSLTVLDPVEPPVEPPVDPPVNPAAPYDLYATDTENRGVIPHEINWPIAPVTNRTINVPADMTLQEAAAQSNAIIIVSAGNHGDFDTRDSTDQRWIIDRNAVFTRISVGRGNGNLRGARIHISGGRFDDVTQGIFLVGDDLLIENVNWRYEFMTLGSGFGNAPFNRVAFVQCSLFAYYGMMLHNDGLQHGYPMNTDFIFAGNYFAGGMEPLVNGGGAQIEFGIRCMSTDRMVLVDNRARNGIQGLVWKNAYRIQDGCRNVFMRRNMTEYGDAIRLNYNDTVPNGEGLLGRVEIYDHRSYVPQNVNGEGLLGFKNLASEANFPNPLITDGNIGYHFNPGNHWMWASQVYPWDVAGTNVELPYEDPPVHSAWLTANNIRPGADHGPLVDLTFAG